MIGRGPSELQRLRTLCLSLPETQEVESWGHPNFKAGTRTFVTFEIFEKQPSIAFRLDAVTVEHLLRRKGFFATPYGRAQWVSLRVDGSVDWQLVDQLARQSYRLVALKRMLAALEGTSLSTPANKRMEPTRGRRRSRAAHP
ncbi:MAG: MmcQ/YjbR family DNA-binding protein [Vicinamibacterales bacterium]